MNPRGYVLAGMELVVEHWTRSALAVWLSLPLCCQQTVDMTHCSLQLAGLQVVLGPCPIWQSQRVAVIGPLPASPNSPHLHPLCHGELLLGSLIDTHGSHASPP